MNKKNSETTKNSKPKRRKSPNTINVGHLTDEEKKQKDELCNYIREEILMYDDGKALPNFLWHRIDSLRRGEVSAKGGIKGVHMYYSYNDILFTFKFCKYEILQYLRNSTFRNEAHKINTIMRIVTSNINIVKDRLKKQEEIKNKIENEDISKFENTHEVINRYQLKSKNNINPELEEYW